MQCYDLWEKFFDQPIKSDIRICDNIQKIATGPGYNYRTGCLLDYNYFKNYYKRIAVDLSKQQADSKAIQQINFIGNLQKKCSNVFHYWRIQRNSFTVFTRRYLACDNITL